MKNLSKREILNIDFRPHGNLSGLISAPQLSVTIKLPNSYEIIAANILNDQPELGITTRTIQMIAVAGTPASEYFHYNVPITPGPSETQIEVFVFKDSNNGEPEGKVVMEYDDISSGTNNPLVPLIYLTQPPTEAKPTVSVIVKGGPPRQFISSGDLKSAPDITPMIELNFAGDVGSTQQPPDTDRLDIQLDEDDTIQVAVVDQNNVERGKGIIRAANKDTKPVYFRK